jgi:hypothetical protein
LIVGLGREVFKRRDAIGSRIGNDGLGMTRDDNEGWQRIKNEDETKEIAQARGSDAWHNDHRE